MKQLAPILAALGLLAAGCPGGKQGAQACTPGESNRCSCEGGGTGLQVCEATGTVFGACSCTAVCAPPAQCVAMPQLAGLDLEAAGAKLDAAGLLLPDPVDPKGFITVQQIADPPVQVLAQSPAAGQPVLPGTRVVLTVTIPPDQASLGLPTSNFLVGHLQQDDEASAAAYYEAVDPGPFPKKSTLADWKAAVGFGTPADAEATAVYVTHTDLGFGRHMHMRRKGRRVAFYVDNYPSLDDAIHGANFIATVAMEYGPGPGGTDADPFFTQFYVFNKRGLRITDPILDDHGPRQQPAVCLVCHGGSASDPTYPSGDIGAHFIPFDLDAEQFSDKPGFTRADQEAAFKAFNEAVLLTWTDRQAGLYPPGDPAPVPLLVDGWYGGPGHPSPVFLSGSYTLPGWDVSQQARDLYHGVFAKSCQTCHAQREPFRNFSTYAKFLGVKSVVQLRVFQEGAMPLSQRGYLNFWLSRPSQPKQLAQWIPTALQGPGTPLPRLAVRPSTTVTAGTLVVLDGSDSQYAETFSWTQTAGPHVDLMPLAAFGSQMGFVAPPLGANFSFQMVVSALGRSAAPVPVSILSQSPPGPPQSVSVAGGAASATVSWSPPANDGLSNILEYVVSASPGNASVTVGSGARQATLTGLQPGGTYVFSVAARNAFGIGMLASVQARVPTPPSAPGNVQCTASVRAVSMTWAKPADDGGSPIIGYTAIATPPVGPAVQAAAAANATGATVSGLANGVTYACTVVASNVAGAGAPSAADQATTPAGTPSAPRNLTGVPGSGTMALSWSPPLYDGGSQLTGYQITWSPATTMPQPASVGPGTTTFTVTGLIGGTAYTFTVMAKNSFGLGDPITGAPPVTPAVSAVLDVTTLSVNWSEPTAVDSFLVEVRLQGNPSVIRSVTLPGIATSTTFTALTACTLYDVTVTATNGFGSGARTVTAARPVPDTPVVFVTPGPARFTANWSPAPNDHGCSINSYSVSYSGPTSSSFSTTFTSTTITGLPSCNYTSNGPGVGTTSSEGCASRRWSISVTANSAAGSSGTSTTSNIRPLVSYIGDNIFSIWSKTPSGACIGCHSAGNALVLNDGTDTTHATSFNNIKNTANVIKSPASTSFLLTCPTTTGTCTPPSGGTVHPGGHRFDVGAPEYNAILQWITDGTLF